MNRFRKPLAILILISAFIPLAANAAVESTTIRNPLDYGTFGDLVNAIIDFIFTISLPIATIMLIVAGFFFITAAGDPEKIKNAKRLIIWALIGLVVVISAKGLVEVIQAVFKARQ